MGATQARVSRVGLAAVLAALPLSRAMADCSSLLAMPFCIAGAAVNAATGIVGVPMSGGSYYQPRYDRHRVSHGRAKSAARDRSAHEATAATAAPNPATAQSPPPAAAPAPLPAATAAEPPPSLYGPPVLHADPTGRD